MIGIRIFQNGVTDYEPGDLVIASTTRFKSVRLVVIRDPGDTSYVPNPFPREGVKK